MTTKEEIDYDFVFDLIMLYVNYTKQTRPLTLKSVIDEIHYPITTYACLITDMGYIWDLHLPKKIAKKTIVKAVQAINDARIK